MWYNLLTGFSGECVVPIPSNDESNDSNPINVAAGAHSVQGIPRQDLTWQWQVTSKENHEHYQKVCTMLSKCNLVRSGRPHPLCRTQDVAEQFCQGDWMQKCNWTIWPRWFGHWLSVMWCGRRDLRSRKRTRASASDTASCWRRLIEVKIITFEINFTRFHAQWRKHVKKLQKVTRNLRETHEKLARIRLCLFFGRELWCAGLSVRWQKLVRFKWTRAGNVNLYVMAIFFSHQGNEILVTFSRNIVVTSFIFSNFGI